MGALGSPLRDARTAAIVVGLTAILVYANSLRNRFAYDDVHIVLADSAVHSLRTLPGALARPYWPTVYGRELGLWRPSTTSAIGLLYVGGGGSALPFHAANVLLHAAVAILVLLLCLSLMPLPASFAAALVFAVHPLHVEAVANAVGIAEILSTAAVLAACLVHVRGPSRSEWGRSLTIGALYAVAFGAKESGVTLPGLIFLIDACRQRIGFADLGRYVRDRWRAYVVMGCVAMALLAGRYGVLGSIAHPFAPLGADLLTDVPRIWTLGEIWTHYVRLWAFPLDLSSDYSPNVIPIALGWNATNVVGVTLALGILLAALLAWRRGDMAPASSTARAAAFGVVWFLVALSPTSNVLFLSGVLMAERTLYLPSVGLAAATGWLVTRVARERPRGAWILLCVALALGAVRTWTRNPTWRDNQAVFSTLLRDVPYSGRSQWLLGDEFLATGNVSQALLSYRAAINILGGHYTLVTEISEKLIGIGAYRAAESLLTSAWRSAPGFARAPSQLAQIRAEYGDASGTERFARESLALYEPDPTRLHLLAWALAAQGRFDEARQARRKGQEMGRARFWQQWMYLAYVRREEGDTVRALEAIDSAWAVSATDIGKKALDSIRVADFGLGPLLIPPDEVEDPVNK